MSLVDIKLNEKYPSFEVENFLIITNTTNNEEYKGFHAHREADQIIIPIFGVIDIYTINLDGVFETNIKEQGGALCIEAGIWSYQTYHPHSSAVVLANLPYDEGDYIRDYRDFLEFCKEKEKNG